MRRRWITLAADLPGVTACGLPAGHYRSPEGRIRQVTPTRPAADESGTRIGYTTPVDVNRRWRRPAEVGRERLATIRSDMGHAALGFRVRSCNAARSRPVSERSPTIVRTGGGSFLTNVGTARIWSSAARRGLSIRSTTSMWYRPARCRSQASCRLASARTHSGDLTGHVEPQHPRLNGGLRRSPGSCTADATSGHRCLSSRGFVRPGPDRPPCREPSPTGPPRCWPPELFTPADPCQPGPFRGQARPAWTEEGRHAAATAPPASYRGV